MSVPVPARSDFLISYPQFINAPAALVDRKLAESARRTRADFFADDGTQNDAVYLRAAILLAKTPDARKLELIGDDQAMVWQMELYDLQRSAGMGVRVF